MRRSVWLASSLLLFACPREGERPAGEVEPSTVEPAPPSTPSTPSADASVVDDRAAPLPPTPEPGPFRSRAEMAALLAKLRG